MFFKKLLLINILLVNNILTMDQADNEPSFQDQEIQVSNLHDFDTLSRLIQQNKIDDLEIWINIPGINRNITGPDGETLLHIAAECNNLEAISLFLEYGINPNIQNLLNISAIDIAILNHGVNPNFPIWQGISLLLNYGASLNLTDEQGNTALHIAAKNNDRDLVLWLLQNGTNPNIKNKYGQTPISLTMDNEIYQAIKFFSSRKTSF